jgi:hypothetical protein
MMVDFLPLERDGFLRGSGTGTLLLVKIISFLKEEVQY